LEGLANDLSFGLQLRKLARFAHQVVIQHYVRPSHKKNYTPFYAFYVYELETGDACNPLGARCFVAPASRRRFLVLDTTPQSPAGRRRHKKLRLSQTFMRKIP
jgi:hypothetical protein